MRIALKKSLLLFIFLFGTLQAFAGAGHSHNVSQSTIKKNASYHLMQLAQKEKIDKSWKDAKFLNMTQRGIISKEWVASFKNSTINDKSKQVIYIYLTTYGKVKGANYQGD